jgi:hypothetical protein
MCRGRRAAHSTTPTYTTGKDSPAREPSWSAFWLQKPSVLRVMGEGGGRGGEKMSYYCTHELGS